MTNEEQLIFVDKIKDTILPIAIYLKDEEIKKIIQEVEKANDTLLQGFGDMLFEQIIILKHNRLGK